ncbi:MAG: Ig domain protein [Marmoricola sp.]|nr:Ig domain protein [Marmoricola sp.]
MIFSSFVGRHAKLVAGTAACAVAATVLGLTSPAVAAPASPVPVLVETGGFTADPVNAITTGWWGHEGAGRTGTSVFSVDGKGSAGSTTSQTLAAQLAKIGPDATVGDLHVAFVVTSADGSAEKPAVSAGETVGQAFTWFDAATLGGSEAGNASSNDYVDALSTETSYNAWFNAGQLTYGFDDNLVAHDATQPGNPVSGAHAIGTSILNTWPTGTNVSMVYYVSTTTNANNEPIVTVGPDGHAETAWMTFTTAGLPSDHSRDPVGSSFPASYDSVRTSAGYVVAGAAVAPTVHISDTWTSGAGTLHASLTNASNVALTNASGTIQFSARAVNATGGAFSAVGSPVAVSATGTASLPISGLTSGQFQEFEATYTPDSAASTTYTSATSGIDQVFAPAATSTVLAVSGTLRYPYHQTFGATVSSGAGTPTGTVTFLDHGVSIGTANLSAGHASLSKGLAIGSHSISARYNGATGFSTSISAARAVTIAKGTPTITPTLSPAASRLSHGQRPRLTVTVRAPGLVATGTLTIVVVAPNRHITTLRIRLSSGKATITLPAVQRGTTKVTIRYSGSSTVAAGTKVFSFRVTR